VLAIAVVGWQLVGILRADAAISPDLSARVEAGSTVDVAVVMPFEPESFHMKYLQSVGRIGGVTGSTVLLRDVSPDRVRSLATQYWIASLKTWPEVGIESD
jgi:hypothetical protein